MDTLSHRLGTVELLPHAPVVAGSVGQWTLVYTVGSYGVDEGGTLKLAQRFASDWEIPQFDRPTAPAYSTLTTTGAAKLRPYYHAKAHERPWMKCLVIDVYDGSLAPGDTVTLVLGDRSQGSPGIRAQTFQESAHEFRWLVDPTNANVALPLPTSPKFPVVPGEPVTLVVIVPSQATVGQPVSIFVKGEDIWGNPTPVSEGLALTWQGPQAALQGSELVASAPGVGRIHATLETAQGTLHGVSNPLAIHTTAPPIQRYWGDLHAQTAPTVGTGDEDEYFTFGRDVARLDFTSHQGNDFQMDDAYWQHLNERTAAYHQEGEFVVFPGYEWSGNTTAGGDHNVFYRHEGMPILRSSHWQIPHVPESDLSPAHPVSELFDKLRANVPMDDVLVANHVGGRYADILRYFDQDLAPLVEVLSCWGVFEWMLWDAFDAGYVVGIMCNSDGHKGRPGAEGPGAGEFGIRSGLTCVLAETQTRDAIFSALKARRCYGTSGPRILLDFTIDGAPMGSIITAGDTLNLRASVEATEPLDSLIIYQGRTPIHTVRPAAFTGSARSRRLRVWWRGARIRGRGRRVVWDGTLRFDGVSLTDAATVSFDAASDGIVEQTPSQISFRSSTTGDTDALDLRLDHGDGGTLTFTSAVGEATIDLAEVGQVGERRVVSFGGLEIEFGVERYPEELTEMTATVDLTLTPPAGRTPYFVKVIQSDGHMAWASPIYVDAA